MPVEVLLTTGALGRTLRSARLVHPGDALAGCVVVSAAGDLAGWDPAALATGLWIVLGDGPLPDGGLPFLRLAPDCAGEPLDRAIDAALEVLRLREELAGQQRETALARERQLDLVRVGIALTAERDLDRLLQHILTTARELVLADAGSLYLIEECDDGRVLRFARAQNDSVPAPLVTTTMSLDNGSLAGYVAVTGEPVAVGDVRHLAADVPFQFNPAVDLAIGYHTRSVLTAPIATRGGEVVGVLQLINRKAEVGARILNAAAADEFVRPFGHDDVAVIRALAAQAAVAIENTRLVGEVERLFEGFVRAAVMAIEQRDPSTSGHSLRVAHYTVSLARALEQNPPPPYRGIAFSRDEMTQLRYAALLHDFGKVGVREAVLTKAKKLFPERLALVQERFRHARRAHEVALLRRLLAALQALGRPPLADDLANLNTALQRVRAELDMQLGTVLIANEPAVLENAPASSVAGLPHQTYPAEDGRELPLLLPEEIRALSVAKGSLDEGERREIESHVVHSYQFLLTIPWPQRLAGVPAVVYGHHERLNGRGYPNRLVAEQIPPEVRMLAVCDIFDALAVGDRPYKVAVSPERALEVLDEEARTGFLDRDLVKLFIESRIFAQRPADPMAL